MCGRKQLGALLSHHRMYSNEVRGRPPCEDDWPLFPCGRLMQLSDAGRLLPRKRAVFGYAAERSASESEKARRYPALRVF